MKDGILAIDKPEGISSAQVVAREKKTLKVKKAGHAGTLDPFATGLLLCGINKGTRISQFFLGGAKQYRATIHLGIETDTCDLTGQVVSDKGRITARQLSSERVAAVIGQFAGPQMQKPPVFSALKHKGQPLYKLARKGIKIDKPARPIEIHSIGISRIDLPFVEISVDCSAGTYIRVLARDIGEKLGCGGHLSALCRTKSSHFTLEAAVTLDRLEQMDMSEKKEAVISMSRALSFMPAVSVGPEDIHKIKFGQRLSADTWAGVKAEDGQALRLVDDKNNLLAVVKFDQGCQRYNYCCVFLN